MDWVDSELARISDPEYVSGLEGVELADLRTRRDECERLETILSYCRRIAEGRMDLVRVALEERAGSAGTSANDETEGASSSFTDSPAERLAAIMACGPPRPPGPARVSKLFSPDFNSEDKGIQDTMAELDSVLSEAQMAYLHEVPLQNIAESLARLTEIEFRLSAQRSSVHGIMDTIDAEVAKRYERGLVTVDALIDDLSSNA
ncbi:MAG: hypothetical protein M1420_05670 [Actinobacteria bacterium]|nr:hypothetical protein [Actinomycetota bacterium]